MKEQYWFYVCLFVKNKLKDTIRINLFSILQRVFASTTNGSSVKYFASVTR